MEEKNVKKIELPCGEFCSDNCVGCIYWNPYNRDDYGRGWCSYYTTYYHPEERNGCFNREGK